MKGCNAAAGIQGMHWHKGALNLPKVEDKGEGKEGMVQGMARLQRRTYMSGRLGKGQYAGKVVVVELGKECEL